MQKVPYSQSGAEPVRKNKPTKRRWDDRDLEKISVLMTLCESGFSESEAVRYLLHLEDRQECDACMALLDTKRHSMLDEIHRREKQIENIDYLKYKIRNGGTNNE